MDYVIVDGLERTPMGFFQFLYQPWNIPKEDDVKNAEVCGIDPFFLEKSLAAAELCVKHNKPYVTIDCEHTDYLHQHAAINVVSRAECLNNHYKGKFAEEAYGLFTDSNDRLVIITRGGDEMTVAISPFPLPLNPPKLEEVQKLLSK